MFLIFLDRQDVVAAALDDLLGNGFLTAHRIDRHQGAMQVQQLQQLGNSGDFIGLAVHRHLAESEVVLGGLGADQMQGAKSTRRGRRMTERLAVDGDVLDTQGVS